MGDSDVAAPSSPRLPLTQQQQQQQQQRGQSRHEQDHRSSSALAPAAGWVRATETLWAACRDLVPGHVVTVPDVSLMDTVVAMPVMDARLDCGIEPLPAALIAPCDRVTEPDPGVPTTPPFDPATPLRPADVCWILDRLLACEASWLESTSLASAALNQTIYTCLYMHHFAAMYQSGGSTGSQKGDPPQASLVFDVLQPAVIGVISSVAVVWNELVRGNLVDGEDYVGDRSGINLCAEMDPLQALSALDDAVSLLNGMSARTAYTTAEAEALAVRLRLRRDYLRCLAMVSQTDPTLRFGMGQDPLAILCDLDKVIDIANDSLLRLRTPSERDMEPSTGPPLALSSPAMDAAPSPEARASFDPWISRHVSAFPGSRGPPLLPPFQPIDLPRPQSTLEVFQQILNGLETYRDLVLKDCSWHKWKTFFDEKAASLETDRTCPYVRSLWQSAVCSDNIVALRKPLTWLAESYLAEVASLDLERVSAALLRAPQRQWGHTVQTDPSHSLSRRLPLFLERLAGQLVAHLRALAQNRARGRRRFAHSYGDLLTLNDEASAIDDSLECLAVAGTGSVNFRAATQLLTLDTMQQIIFSGFELDLHRAEEYSSAYWVAARIADETCSVAAEMSASVGDLFEQRHALQKLGVALAPTQTFLHHLSMWSSGLFDACEAFFLLYKPLGQIARHQPWVMSVEDDHAVQNGVQKGPNETRNGTRPSQSHEVPLDRPSQELLESAFKKRYAWLRVLGRPESADQLTSLWKSYKSDGEQVREMDVSFRLQNADALLRKATQSLRSLHSQGVGQLPIISSASHQLLSVLANDLEKVSRACRELPRSRASPEASTNEGVAHASALVPLKHSWCTTGSTSEHHPWFPFLREA